MNHRLILKTKISEVPKKPCPEILKPKQSRNALGRQDGGDRSERGLRSTCCHCPAGVSRMMDRLNPCNLPPSQPKDGPGSGQRCRPEMRKGSLSGLNFLKGPPWSKTPQDVMLLSVVQATLKPEIHMDTCSLCTAQCLCDVHRFCCLREPC